MDAVILAAGKGTRMNAGYNKMFVKINGREILWHTVNRFCSCSIIDNIIVVTGKDDISGCMEICTGFPKNIRIIEGGCTRQESSLKGIKMSGSDYVMIHDGARPLVTDADIINTANAAIENGAAAVGTASVDTLKTCDENGFINGTLDRNKIYKIFTPQAFDRKMLENYHEKAKEDGISVTDDSALCEYCGKKVKFVHGSQFNIKMTTQEDILIAETLLKLYN